MITGWTNEDSSFESRQGGKKLIIFPRWKAVSGCHTASKSLDTGDVCRLWTGPGSPAAAVEINPLNSKLNPICHFLAVLGAHHILHFSRIRVKNAWNYI